MRGLGDADGGAWLGLLLLEGLAALLEVGGGVVAGLLAGASAGTVPPALAARLGEVALLDQVQGAVTLAVLPHGPPPPLAAPYAPPGERVPLGPCRRASGQSPE